MSEGGAHFPRSIYHHPRSNALPPIPSPTGLRRNQTATLPAPAEESPLSSTDVREEENEAQSSEDSEQEYCPICGRRFSRIIMPFSSHADAATQQRAREEHIMECISQYTSPRRRPQHHHPTSSNPDHNQQSPISTHGGASSSASLPSAAGASSNGRFRADTTGGSGLFNRQRMGIGRRNTPRRMLVYHATEKDCHPLPSSSSSANVVNNPTTTPGGSRDNPPLEKSPAKQPDTRLTENDGTDNTKNKGVECLICLEEFEPGVLLARLECLCKFHERCLRAWWIAKANASPPPPPPGGPSDYGNDGEGEGEGVCPVHYQSLF